MSSRRLWKATAKAAEIFALELAGNSSNALQLAADLSVAAATRYPKATAATAHSVSNTSSTDWIISPSKNNKQGILVYVYTEELWRPYKFSKN